MKRKRHSRTLWANVGVALLATWFDRSDFYVSPLWFIWAIALLNLWLRLVTRHPVQWPRLTRREGTPP